MNAAGEFVEILKSSTVEATVLEIYHERVVRPISDVKILRTTDNSVVVEVRQGSVLRIGDYFYVWDEAQQDLSVHG